jgi:hypothetical protein
MAFPWRKMTKAVARSEDVAAMFEHRGAECQAVLTGRITIDSSPELREALLERLASPSCRILTIDFNEVAYVDTSGLKQRPRYLLETTRLLRFFHEADVETVQKSDSSESPQ